MDTSRAYLLPALLATLGLAACDLHAPATSVAPPVTATVEGSIETDYTGTGTFQVVPPSVPTPIRFSISSNGVGASEGQKLWLLGRSAPAGGRYEIQELRLDPRTGGGLYGELNEGAYAAFYSYREGNTLRVFSASSGALQVTESQTGSTPGRIAGAFTLTGTLTSVCTAAPGFPGDIMSCEPAGEEATVEITGSFRAGPIGGDTPGLIPSP
jgi:hypothetical protein